MNTATTGLVLGKFYPPHQGHQYVISMAEHFVDELYIVVEEMPREYIAATKRARWLETLYPRANVLVLSDFNPQQPSEHPEFWSIWRTSLQRLLAKKIDYVFAGEAYGKTLAEQLNAEFIGPGERSLHAVSGTQIRDKPRQHWHMLSDVVQAHYRKRVCICGPESTGKTTLSKKLAAHFDSKHCTNSFVPEFARNYLSGLGRELRSKDFFNIAKGQAASEAAMYAQAGPLQITDTGVNATAIWHRFLMGNDDAKLNTFCENYQYDLYLLCMPDVPWVDDDFRYLPNQGADFLRALLGILSKAKANVIQISGGWESRWQQALASCEKLY